MDLQKLIGDIATHMHAETWIVQVFVVVFATLLLDWSQKRIVQRIHSGLQKTRTVWDDALVDALRKPLSLLIWIVGLAFAGQIILRVTGAAIFEAARPMREVGVIGALAWFLVRFVDRAKANIIQNRLAAGRSVDRTSADAIAKLLRISIVITALLVILQTLGYSISGVLAFGGIGGVAVGFVAKDLLANFFGGLMIYLDRPFEVGDWIRSPDKEIEGTVEEIGWRLTRIRTFDARPLYVPNSIFTSIAVENPSRMTNRRIYETIGIRYDDAGAMAQIVNDVREMLKAHPDIDTDKTMIVNFNAFAASSLNFFIYTFTRTTNWIRFHEVKQDVMLRVIDIIDRHGAQCAFPTSTIHIVGTPAPESD